MVDTTRYSPDAPAGMNDLLYQLLEEGTQLLSLFKRLCSGSHCFAQGHTSLQRQPTTSLLSVSGYKKPIPLAQPRTALSSF